MTSAMRTEVLRFTLLSKNVLTPEETELYELSQLAGVTLDPDVFKILLDLLKLNVAPSALLQMLKSMTGSYKKKPAPANPVLPQAAHTDSAHLQSVPTERVNLHGSRTESHNRSRTYAATRRPEARR
ncbi:mitotic-spindle organizing protein 2A-like [Gigantopelta aegis]|uniref:mitotic-spindle organizing protein 2A-like n=1 Tax=Gigantopelta aegis TaxID=1735272 RepID=UPI001B889CC4|nr:mitotic-spindle organizing protein 2A-like [Gigantopelta aegis]